MARSRSKIHREFDLNIDDLSHDGRGVGRLDGKAVFVSGALPGEVVRVKQTGRNRHFDEGVTLAVLTPSPERVEARCEHFGVCAGCVLQHLNEASQITAKQRVLLENLTRIGHVVPEHVLEPLLGTAWGYRRKGRFSVRFVEKKGRTVVGFREIDSRFVAELRHCHTLIPRLGERINELSALVDSLEGKRTVPQIEFIADDTTVALVFRHIEPLSSSDRERLLVFAQDSGFAVFLQPGGIESVHPLWPERLELSFLIPDYNISLSFQPLDFIQVNSDLNQKMIARAIALLAPSSNDRVLDLFCGLGNFTLPLGRTAGHVVGVEGEASLVARARANARRNELDNVEFYATDLTRDLSSEPWMRSVSEKGGFDKVLLDPPRAGAAEVLAQLPLKGVRRIVYVSCHPGSLARDAGFLVRERGYRLVSAGAMDMFPHTAHVEAIALFEK